MIYRILILLACLSFGCSPANKMAERPVNPRCVQLPLSSVELASSLAREPVHRAFRRHHGRFRCCWERLLARQPDREHGSVVIDATIKRGHVQSVSVEPRGLDDATFLACVSGVADAMTIPEWIPNEPPDRDASRDEHQPGSFPIPEPAEESDVIHIRFPIRFRADDSFHARRRTATPPPPGRPIEDGLPFHE